MWKTCFFHDTLEISFQSFVMNIKKYFKGRIDRKNYTLLVGWIFALCFSLSTLLYYFFSAHENLVTYFIYLGFFLSFMVVWVMSVRRLHDMGENTKYVAFLFVPFVHLFFILILMAARPEQLKNRHGIPVPPSASFQEVLTLKYDSSQPWTLKKTPSQKRKKSVQVRRNILK